MRIAQFFGFGSKSVNIKRIKSRFKSRGNEKHLFVRFYLFLFNGQDQETVDLSIEKNNSLKVE